MIKTWIFLFLLFFVSCAAVKTDKTLPKNPRLKLIGQYVLPHNMQFNNTTVGGLSGIDYDAKNDVYYLICDDASVINPARFYTARISINEKGIDMVQLVDVTILKKPDGKPYPNTKENPGEATDPEAMRYYSKTGDLFWCSEGERTLKKDIIALADPLIRISTREGMYKDSLALPANMRMKTIENGPRHNSVFEGLTFADNYKTVFVSVEEPIYEDGLPAGLGDSSAWIRILKYDMTTRKQVAQYAYRIEPVAHPPSPGAFKINGVTDILSVGENKLLVLERSFSTGRRSNTIRVFLADINKATDIQPVSSLPAVKDWIPASKTLLLSMDGLGIHTDNIEGMTFGPRLPNGHQTLIFVSDNNFSREQLTQFLLFEIE